MSAPDILHRKLDEIFDASDIVTIAGGKYGGDGHINIRIFGPPDQPLFFAYVGSELLFKAARAQDCPTRLATISQAAAQMVDDDLSGKSSNHVAH